MTKFTRRLLAPATLALVNLLLACSGETPADATVPGRWYSAAQVAEGEISYQSHCAVCHGESAEGTADWRQTGDNGNYPPPPLNGSAHTWHHPLPILERTIAVGGIPPGGVMPGFGETLSRDEAHATIAYFQSFWPDDIYARWEEINSR